MSSVAKSPTTFTFTCTWTQTANLGLIPDRVIATDSHGNYVETWLLNAVGIDWANEDAQYGFKSFLETDKEPVTAERAFAFASAWEGLGYYLGVHADLPRHFGS